MSSINIYHFVEGGVRHNAGLACKIIEWRSNVASCLLDLGVKELQLALPFICAMLADFARMAQPIAILNLGQWKRGNMFINTSYEGIAERRLVYNDDLGS